jgi:hypothetical protein
MTIWYFRLLALYNKSFFQVYADRACKRTINSLEVKCQNYGSECEWSGELANLPVCNLFLYLFQNQPLPSKNNLS